jgi:hypothetical protein
MTKPKFFYENIGLIRKLLNDSIEAADQVHAAEANLIKILCEIDKNRFYVRAGYKSLRGFCNKALRFSRLQSQRIATKVRRYEPVVNIGTEGASPRTRPIANPKCD